MADITRKRNLNPKRRNRTYPKVVKRARHDSYRAKKPLTKAPPPRAANHCAGQPAHSGVINIG